MNIVKIADTVLKSQVGQQLLKNTDTTDVAKKISSSGTTVLEPTVARRFGTVVGSVFGERIGNATYKALASEASETEMLQMSADVSRLRSELISRNLMRTIDGQVIAADVADEVIDYLVDEQVLNRLDGKAGGYDMEQVRAFAIAREIAITNVATLQAAIGPSAMQALIWVTRYSDPDVLQDALNEVEQIGAHAALRKYRRV